MCIFKYALEKYDRWLISMKVRSSITSNNDYSRFPVDILAPPFYTSFERLQF